MLLCRRPRDLFRARVHVRRCVVPSTLIRDTAARPSSLFSLLLCCPLTPTRGTASYPRRLTASGPRVCGLCRTGSLADCLYGDQLERTNAEVEAGGGALGSTSGAAAAVRGAKEGRPMPEAAAVSAVGQLCAGLAYLHANRIIHRDLKPANVLLGPSRPLCLCLSLSLSLSVCLCLCPCLSCSRGSRVPNALCCTIVLHCIALCCTIVLHCVALCCTIVLHCVALCCTIVLRRAGR